MNELGSISVLGTIIIVLILYGVVFNKIFYLVGQTKSSLQARLCELANSAADVNIIQSAGIHDLQKEVVYLKHQLGVVDIQLNQLSSSLKVSEKMIEDLCLKEAKQRQVHKDKEDKAYKEKSDLASSEKLTLAEEPAGEASEEPAKELPKVKKLKLNIKA